jgi:RNase adapter protein RapZ
MNDAITSYYEGSDRIRLAVESFGFLHRPAPEADIVIDLRTGFRNPANDPAFRELTGLEPRIRDHVLATDGIPALLDRLAALTEVFLETKRDAWKLTRVAIGCAGGRHRSVVAANELVNRAVAAGIGAEVAHLDILKPVVTR